MKKCIKKGVNSIEICHLGDKSLVLWSQIAFYGSADVSPQNTISDHKTDDLPPKWQFWRQLSPNLLTWFQDDVVGRSITYGA